jgi:uncharacterized Ntn-hydrolase superfamily protein
MKYMLRFLIRIGWPVVCRRLSSGSAIITIMIAVAIAPATAFATFSIVAVDTMTGAVGSAGASCIAGAQIIHDVIAGLGAINTQAYYLAGNQARADSLLKAGLEPDSILAILYLRDVEGDPTIRQYGVVTLAGPGRSAGYTGINCTDYKGHRVGPGYSIQGNILLGAHVLDTMEFAFLHTPGPLEDRLMAALEAADLPGADTRCLSCNKPAYSAFVKVMHPSDGTTPYLYKYVNNTNCPVDPIPLLRIQYDAWKALQRADPDSSLVTMTPNVLAANGVDSATMLVTPRNNLGQAPTAGASVSTIHSGGGTSSASVDNGNGTFTIYVHAPVAAGTDTISVLVDAGWQVTTLNRKPVLTYYLPGDADGSGAIDISDAVWLIAYIFSGGPAPSPLIAGDGNCDGSVDISDAVYLIAYIFAGGPAPCAVVR